MKKLLMTLFVVTLVFGLVLAIGGDEAAAMSSLKEVQAGTANCATCHTGAGLVKIPDHSSYTGTSCETCHQAAAPEPAPAPAPAPAPSAPAAPAAPAANDKPAAPAPAPRPAAPVTVKQNMDFTVVGTFDGTRYTATNNFEVRNYQNHVYIKVRDLVDLVGDYLYITEFNWDNTAKAVNFATLNNQVVINTKQAAFEINGVEIVPSRGARIIDNFVYVPVRAFVEALGGTVLFDAKDGITVSVPKF